MKGSLSICLPLLAIAGAAVHAQTLPPIQHVILIVQENRTPDNLFQDPNLIANGADIQKAPDKVAAVPLVSCWDIDHSHSGIHRDGTSGWVAELADQKKKGDFCNVNYDKCGPVCPPDMYVENTPQDRTIQPYWTLAETYGFANYMFQTNEGPSFPAHQFLFSGTSAPVSGGPPTQYANDFAAENLVQERLDSVLFGLAPLRALLS